MRKLLVLMLVLGLASWASASPVSISGPTSLTIGQTGTYTISLSGTPRVICFDMDIHLNNELCPSSNWTIIATNIDTGYNYIGDPLHTPPNYGKEITAMQSSGNTPVGDDWITFQITNVDQTSNWTNITLEEVSFWDTNWLQITDMVLNSLAVHNIPEPMTLVLLGLGGLFLRRRK
jgi:hypothetical protein